MEEILIKNRTYRYLKKLVSYADTSFFIFSNSNSYFITTRDILKNTRNFFHKVARVFPLSNTHLHKQISI